MMRMRSQAPSAGIALLEVHGLTKAYGERIVLDSVSFRLHEGDIALLVGANGTGKSTLLRCVAGLAAFHGTVRVMGVDPASGAEGRGRVGYLPQQVTLPESVTVGEVIAFFARLRGLRLRRPEEFAAAVRLPDGFLPPLDRPVGALSGGMGRRVALAVALLGSPPLLLLDEPTASLDEEGSASLSETLRALRASGAAALIAVPLLLASLLRHDLATVADRVLLLEDGRLAHDGAIGALRPFPGSPDRDVFSPALGAPRAVVEGP